MAAGTHLVPQFISDFDRPPGTDIKHINGHWYLYKCDHVYNKLSKRSERKWGAYLGRVDETGFHPKKSALVHPKAIVEVGATRWCMENSQWMRERLDKFFPDIGDRVYTCAVLEAVENERIHRLGMRYQDSIISRVIPNLPMSAPSMTNLITALGSRKQVIKDFMKVDVAQDADYFLVDGHRILTAAEDMATAAKGYDSKMRFMDQISLFYMVRYNPASDVSWPVYYQQLRGSVPDVSAVPEILEDLDVLPEHCMIVGDKGCASKENFALISGMNLFYLMPLKRDNAFVQGKIPHSGDYENVFTYHNRPIQYICFPQDGFNVFLFLDTALYTEELASLTHRVEEANEQSAAKAASLRKQIARLQGATGDPKSLMLMTQADLSALLRKRGIDAPTPEAAAEHLAAIAKLQQSVADLKLVNVSHRMHELPAMGTITLCTNQTQLTGHEVYRMYKRRNGIEDFFKTYSATLGFDASYMQDEQKMLAWLFLNHLVSLITVTGLDMLEHLPTKGKLSWDDVRRALSMVRAIEDNDHWRVAQPTPDVLRICDRLNIDPYDLSILEGRG